MLAMPVSDCAEQASLSGWLWVFLAVFVLFFYYVVVLCFQKIAILVHKSKKAVNISSGYNYSYQ